ATAAPRRMRCGSTRWAARPRSRRSARGRARGAGAARGRRRGPRRARRAPAGAVLTAGDLLQPYAQRAARAVHSFPAPDAVFREFEETFPFEETPDQEKAIETVLADMQNGVPMDRLICGD